MYATDYLISNLSIQRKQKYNLNNSLMLMVEYEILVY